MLFASNSLESLRVIASEGIELLNSRGFKLRNWVANFQAKEISSSVPHCDLATNFSQVDFGSSDPLPISKTLGLARDLQDDKFCVNCKELVNASTKRKMSSQLTSQFDQLGMAAPHLLGGKPVLLRVAALGVDWDEILRVDIKDC